jgi:hypothetical protein
VVPIHHRYDPYLSPLVHPVLGPLEDVASGGDMFFRTHCRFDDVEVEQTLGPLTCRCTSFPTLSCDFLRLHLKVSINREKALSMRAVLAKGRDANRRASPAFGVA